MCAERNYFNKFTDKDHKNYYEINYTNKDTIVGSTIGGHDCFTGDVV